MSDREKDLLVCGGALPARPERLPLALDSRDVAAVLRVSERTAQRLIRSGSLGPFTEFAGRLRVRRDHFWRSLAGQARRKK